MKVLCINGLSGTGKSTFARDLCSDLDGLHLIQSVTTRPQREYEVDHIFVSKSGMFKRKIKEDPIAETKINGHLYCAFPSQFQEGKVNVYVVDGQGVEDMKASDWDVLAVRLINDPFTIERSGRYGLYLSDDEFDLLVDLEDGNTSSGISSVWELLVDEGWL